MKEKKEIAISVKDVHIKYRGLKQMNIKNIFSLGKKKKTNDFEAIKGISFEIEKGKILGIIGRNGSGKTTILRAIAGIFSADEGTIDLKNNTVSLLSIGVGFQKKLTGYENIFLSGLLLGFTESEIKANIDKIIEFSELGDFIYKPVRTYSSGMHSKLAFAITAILESDVMLIDEVLSVGDAKFKKKSYAKMKELINDENRTVVIVSHSLETLKKLCNEILWLNDGKIKMQGAPKDVIPLYEEFMKA